MYLSEKLCRAGCATQNPPGNQTIAQQPGQQPIHGQQHSLVGGAALRKITIDLQERSMAADRAVNRGIFVRVQGL